MATLLHRQSIRVGEAPEQRAVPTQGAQVAAHSDENDPSRSTTGSETETAASSYRQRGEPSTPKAHTPQRMPSAFGTKVAA